VKRFVGGALTVCLALALVAPMSGCSGTDTSSSEITSDGPAQDQAAPATTPPTSEAAPTAPSNQASKWFKRMKVTEMGDGLATTWEEFAAQAPPDSVATFSFSKIGDDRWYKFKFNDGTSINACFKEPHGAGTGLELYMVDIDTP